MTIALFASIIIIAASTSFSRMRLRLSMFPKSIVAGLLLTHPSNQLAFANVDSLIVIAKAYLTKITFQ